MSDSSRIPIVNDQDETIGYKERSMLVKADILPCRGALGDELQRSHPSGPASPPIS